MSAAGLDPAARPSHRRGQGLGQITRGRGPSRPARLHRSRRAGPTGRYGTAATSAPLPAEPAAGPAAV
jgi:hypothetical protein